MAAALSRKFSVVCLEAGLNHNSDPAVKLALDSGTLFMTYPSNSRSYSGFSVSEPVPSNRGWPFPIQWGSMVGGSGNHDWCLAVHPSPLFMKNFRPPENNKWSESNTKRLINSYENYQGADNSKCPRGHSGDIRVLPSTVNLDTTSFNYKLMSAVVSQSQFDKNAENNPADSNCVETSFSSKVDLFWRLVNDTQILRSSPGLDSLNSNVMDSSGYGVGSRKLRVLTGAVVDKFEVDSSKRATSVRANVNGVDRVFHASRRIVISANAIFTPGILERSGVGDPNLLASLGIPLVASLPAVGENFQTHPGTLFIMTTNAPIHSDFFTGHGLLSVLPEFDGMRSVQIYMFEELLGVIPGLSRSLGLLDLPPGFKRLVLAISILTPASRGSVHINSKVPSRFPTVKPNAFSDSQNRDLRLMEKTLRIIYEAVKDLQSKDSGAHSYNVLYPPAEAFTANDGGAMLRSFALDLPFSQAHFSSTASMGTVLDTNLQLKGVSGVTVADTSSWHLINNGNTRTQAMLTGAYAAEHLLGTLE